LSELPETGIDDFSSRAGAALVTGASGGLGAAAARLLASRGATVALTYKSNADAVEQLAAAIRSEGGEVSCHQLDLVDAERCAAVVAEVVDRHGARMSPNVTSARCPYRTCAPKSSRMPPDFSTS